MTWHVVWTRPALRDLNRLDRQVAQRVRAAVRRLAASGLGDVMVLRGSGGERRLRVGDWRVRFERDVPSSTITVLRVLPRGRAYRE